MAPVAGRITNREKDRVCFLDAPWQTLPHPTDTNRRVMRVLEKVWRLLAGEAVCVVGTRGRALSKSSRSMSLGTLTPEIQSGSGFSPSTF